MYTYLVTCHMPHKKLLLSSMMYIVTYLLIQIARKSYLKSDMPLYKLSVTYL